MTDQEIWDNDSIMAANGLHAQLPMERLKPLVNAVAAPLLERFAALEAQVEQAAQPVYQVKQSVGASVWCDVSRAEFDEAAYFGVTKRVLYTSLPKAAPLTAIEALAQPAGEAEPVAQWQKKHPLRTDGRWKNTDEHDAKWWRDNAKGWDIRALYTAPQQSQPLTYEQKQHIHNQTGAGHALIADVTGLAPREDNK